jgi:hypothetical protein
MSMPIAGDVVRYHKPNGEVVNALALGASTLVVNLVYIDPSLVAVDGLAERVTVLGVPYISGNPLVGFAETE